MKRLLLLCAIIMMGATWVPESAFAGEEEARFKFGGSMRGRFEFFRFSQDETGSKKDTRGRIRYRFRFDGKFRVNERAKFQFRLVSGNDSRSGNQTIGDPGDFAPNKFAIRTAMMTLTPWADGRLPGDKGYWGFDFGRVTNPFVWKGNGRDMMLWDNDIALGGLSSVFNYKVGDSGKLLFNAGWYMIDEESSGEKDPAMGAAQLGFTAGKKTRAGIRGSFYHYYELDEDFIHRGVDGENVDGSKGATASGGNVPDGLTGSVDGGKLDLVSTQGFVGFMAGSVTMTAFGGYSTNLSAEASELFPGVGKENIAYNAGLEGGNRKGWFKLGAAYFYIEANAAPSQFIDSDFLDGHTNRHGMLVYFQKQVMKSTDFNVQLFSSDAIETGDKDAGDSVKNSERVRLQVDLLYRF